MWCQIYFYIQVIISIYNQHCIVNCQSRLAATDDASPSRFPAYYGKQNNGITKTLQKSFILGRCSQQNNNKLFLDCSYSWMHPCTCYLTCFLLKSSFWFSVAALFYSFVFQLQLQLLGAQKPAENRCSLVLARQTVSRWTK